MTIDEEIKEAEQKLLDLKRKRHEHDSMRRLALSLIAGTTFQDRMGELDEDDDDSPLPNMRIFSMRSLTMGEPELTIISHADGSIDVKFNSLTKKQARRIILALNNQQERSHDI